MWLKFQCKRDHSMVSDSTQENQSPAKLVSMKFLDAREMGGVRRRHYQVISQCVGSGGEIKMWLKFELSHILISPPDPTH